MKKLIVFTLASLCSAVALAGQQIDKSLDADPDGYVQIENLTGQVKLVGWDNPQVKISGEIDDKARDLIFERDGSQIIFKLRFPHGSSPDRDSKDDVEVFVPKNSKLSFTTFNADVEVSELSSRTEVETVNGDIKATQLAGKVKLTTVNGKIDADNIRAREIKLETVNGRINSNSKGAKREEYNAVNGDIFVTSDGEDVEVGTVNGEIEANLGKVSQFTVSTVNGRVDASMELLPGGEVEASSVGGSINLNFQKDVAARFEVQGHAGGNIHNEITSDKMQKNKYGPGRWLTFSTGNGNGRVEISTVHGRVKLSSR
ncbi:DUF4097 family beta strand repeat-containing protein [Neptunicella marina]|uniref:DUF4097 family beta strand repeat protein n=1 Tax=Neptunicella marina TaxID=2125989 RepID=A0A8J6IW80_9ALTE|nr:DUF4097 family beta strand repeat-containing protein [Neptunicella marina]MBC3766845.1 DUF4097 family beta strand repeat protein [Neptunicella marina]